MGYNTKQLPIYTSCRCMYVRNYMCTHIISVLHNALYNYYNSHATLYRINIMLSQVHYNIIIGKKYTLCKTLYNYARFTILAVHACTQGTCIFGVQMEQFMYCIHHFQCCKMYVYIIRCMFCTCVHDINNNK